MSQIIKPYELGQETAGSATIPSFVLGQWLTVRMAPPKNKGVRDGLVSTLALMSYSDKDGKEVEMVNIADGGKTISFPNGKRGIMATKYRGPKSYYKFVNSETGKWYQVGVNDPNTNINPLLTIDGAIAELTKRIDGWDTLDDAEKEKEIDDYFEEFYLFGLAKDYNLPYEANEDEVPFVGLATDFYRRYTPPKEGERYGNVIATKFATTEGKEILSGDYKTVDEETAVAVYEALVTKDESASSFDPTNFTEDNEEETI